MARFAVRRLFAAVVALAIVAAVPAHARLMPGSCMPARAAAGAVVAAASGGVPAGAAHVDGAKSASRIDKVHVGAGFCASHCGLVASLTACDAVSRPVSAAGPAPSPSDAVMRVAVLDPPPPKLLLPT